MNFQYTLLASERVFDGFLKINRYRLTHELFMGGTSQALIRERLEGLSASSVLLYDPDLDKVVLVEQFRIGALEQSGGPWMIETIGGLIGEGETPEQVARREAREEADCEVRELEKICTFMVSPGHSVDRINLFCGRVDASGAGGVHGLDHEGEDIRVVVMDAHAAFGELYTGRMNSTSIIIALQWLLINRQRLRESWSGGVGA